MCPLSLDSLKPKCHIHPDRVAVATLDDTGERVCAECYREHLDHVGLPGDDKSTA